MGHQSAKTEGCSKVIPSAKYLTFVTTVLLLWARAACGTEPLYRFQYVCLHRSLPPCIAAETFVERVSERTDGRVQIEISSYAELNLDRTITLELARDGTVEFAEVTGKNFDILYMDNFFGLYDDFETQAKVTEAIRGDIERIIEERTGTEVLAYQYYPSNYYFAKKPILTVEDIKDLKIRSPSPVLQDLLDGMGTAPPPNITLTKVYDRLESGVLDAAITCSACGLNLKWYEVTGYLMGPIVNLGHSWMVMNKEKWTALPSEIQEVIREEAAVLEELTQRNALTTWDQVGVQGNIEKGMELVKITPELKELARRASLTREFPEWIERVGGLSSEAVAIYNEKVAPILKVKIAADGQAIEVK